MPGPRDRPGDRIDWGRRTSSPVEGRNRLAGRREPFCCKCKDGPPPMLHARSRPRFWRVVRVRYRLLVRRLNRETPDWMRWLTPWGTSLATHALLLLILGIWAVATSSDGWLGRRPAA